MSLFNFPNIYLDQIGPLKFEHMSLLEWNHKGADCSGVSLTVKFSGQDLMDFISSPCSDAKLYQTPSAANLRKVSKIQTI